MSNLQDDEHRRDRADPLAERLHLLGREHRPAVVPAGLSQRVRRRHARQTATRGGLVALAVVSGVLVLNSLPQTSNDRPGPPAAKPVVLGACAADELTADPPAAVGVSSRTLLVRRDETSGGQCSIPAFRVVTAGGTERSTARGGPLRLLPGESMRLDLGWERAACPAEPAQLLVEGLRGGSFRAASIALPECGSVTLRQSVLPSD